MSTTIESLELEILSSSQSAESGLDKLTDSLERLKLATKGGLGLGAVAKQIKNISTEIDKINSNSVGNLEGLTKAIDLLSGKKISPTIAKQITAMSTAINGADFTGGKDKLDSLVTALSPLSNLPKTNLASYVNNIKKLPDVLNNIDTRALYTKIQSITRILRPFADEMQKIANGFSAFPAKIQKLITQTDRLATTNTRASKSYIDLWAKLKMGAASVRNIASKIESIMRGMMGYYETINLFSVSMGEYAVEAAEYAEQVGEVMGIDPAEWMKYQGTIMTLAKGFGIAGDRAYTMSQQLTQLAYDIASFRDLPIETAMQKIQSGFAGELEPLRAIGYDLSQAKLQATALELGIDKAVTTMTQAEKAQLRYYAIMTQVIDSHEDMAKTLDSPANQMRILKSQVTQAARAIGGIFIPILNEVLPYLIAAAKVVRVLANEIASLVGFELPEVKFDGENAAGGIENVSGALDDATESAKKLKSYMLGFDELNVIDPTEGSGSGDNSASDQFDFELPTYNFLDQATESRVNQIVEDMKEWLGLTGEITSWSDLLDTKFGKILNTVGLIGAAIGAWKIVKATAKALELIGDIKEKFSLGKTPKAIDDVAKEVGSVGDKTSTLTTKLTTLVKNLALGIVVVAEVAVAAALIVGAIWLLGKELEQVGIAWQPVIDNAGTVAIAVGVGTALLVSVGLVTAALGKSGKTLIVNIALGTAMLAEIGVAAALFLGEIWVVGKLLDQIGIAWQPVLNNGEAIATAIGIGTGLLVGIGVVAALLGVAATATAGTVPLAIGIGTAMLLELGVAAGLFLAEIWMIGKLLDEIGKAWKPVLNNGDTIETGIAVGTGLLIGIGVVAAALGIAAVASVGLLPLAIEAGTGMLLQLADSFGDFCDALSDVSDDITYTLSPALKRVNKVLPDTRTHMSDFVNFMKSFAGDMVVYTASSVISGIAATINKFVGFFTTDPIQHLADEVDEQYKHLTKNLIPNLQKAIPKIEDATKLLKDYNTAMGDFEAAGGTSGVASAVRNLVLNLTVSVVDKATSAWSKIKETFAPAKNWFQTNISTPVGNTFSTLWENVKKGATDGWDKITKSFSKDGNAFSGLTSGISNVFKTVVNWLIDGINKVISTPFNAVNTAITALKNATIAGWQPFKNLNTITVPQIPKIPMYAEGGFPDMGQVFVAREAGAELIGNIGGRTAVVNNDQIVESVSTGVYQAVVAALGNGNDDSGDTQIVINLDGEKIYENQQRVARGRGYNLGMGVFSFG